MKTLLGTGIFMWDAPERRTQRYGYFYPGKETFDNNATVTPVFHLDKAQALFGSKVKIIVKVIEARQSSHQGDLYLDILPKTPTVGEEIVLGVGMFSLQKNEFEEGVWDIGIKPVDGRARYWIDPHQYYKLHDQTVEIYAVPTDEPCHDAPKIVPVREAGKAISNGDGSIQFVEDIPDGATIVVKPKVERLGKGMFKVKPPNADGNRGESFDMEVKK